MASPAQMNVLLDTCALIALARGELPKQAAAALKTATEAYVSSISPWEVAIKVAAGKLKLADPPIAWFVGVSERYELLVLPLDARTACAAAGLPNLHNDPFDRILVALSQIHGIPVLTSDKNIPRYPGVKTLW
jgi:PIN domain nuclease of toxin-antitoxin system